MTVHRLAVAAACLLAAGCGGSGAVDVGPASQAAHAGTASSGTAVTTGGVDTLPSRLGLDVWLERDGGLVAVKRSVTPTVSVIRAAITALLAGPRPAEQAAGVTTAVPAATQVLGISLHAGVATVDLTTEFGSGSAALERLRMAQLVYTVTQFPGVRALRLHLDGQPVSAFADGLVLPDPVRRTSMGFAALVSPIDVASPQPGASLRAPFTVTGVANVFEARLSYRLLDAAGHSLQAGDVSASCGTGCPGEFSFTIDNLGVSSRQEGTLVIAGDNPSGRPGGAPVVRVPLRLIPAFDVTSPKPGATITSPVVIAFRYPVASPVLLRVFDARFHLLGRRVVAADCIGPCPPDVQYGNHVRFSVAGLQKGYVVVSPLHPGHDASSQTIEIPVTLNGG